MGTKIKVWEIDNNKLIPISTTMTEEGRKEKEDLEKWIKSHPEILGDDIAIIAEQPTLLSTNKPDFIAVDSDGNIVIVELKRDAGDRDAVAQTIDYASEIYNSFNDVDDFIKYFDPYCEKLNHKKVDMYLSEIFQEGENYNLDIKSIKILIVTTQSDNSTERIVEWLSENYGMDINVLIITYVMTKDKKELLTRTVIVPEKILKKTIKREKRDDLANRIRDAVKEGRLAAGTTLELDIENSKVDETSKNKLRAKKKQDSNYFNLEITNIPNRLKVVKWMYDNNYYSMGGITTAIINDLSMPENQYWNILYAWKIKNQDKYIYAIE